MEKDIRKAYSEVVEILKLIDDEERLEQLPVNVVELIKSNSDPEYKPIISKEIPIEEQNLMDETYLIIAWLTSKYWPDLDYIQDEGQEENIKEEKIEQKPKVHNAAVYNDIERETLEKVDQLEEIENIDNLPVVLNDVSWFEKIKKQIIQFLKNIFKLNKHNMKNEENEKI